MCKRPSALLVVFAATALSACGGPVFDQQIDGPYRLRAADVQQERVICYGADPCLERVPATISAVGSSADFIVALRHPLKGEGSRSSDADEYYYIDRKADGPTADPSAAVHGPFDLTAYGAEQERLGLPPLQKIDHIRNPRP